MRTARGARAGLPRSAWGTVFAHVGVGVALIGIVCETTWDSEDIATMKPSDVADIAGYELKLDGMTQRQGPNYREMAAQFTRAVETARVIGIMEPSKRSFTTRGRRTPKRRC